ncbi:MAG: hypothetical protein IKI64_07690 [Clostridia bacterium]|nr:hypothetical protein [Clostridia bacterium]
MIKTKLGISNFLLAAIIYLLGLFSNTVALVVAVGYVLIREDDAWLRKGALKAIILHLVILVLQCVVAFMPDLLGLLNSFLNIFKVNVNFGFISSVKAFLNNSLDILRTVLFFLLALFALLGKNIPIPVVEGMAEKHSK